MEKEAAVASDDDWAEMDQWLSRKLEEPAEQPRNTRQRWETISKGHVHDHFLSQNAKRWEALGASARLSANLEALGFEHPSTAQALCFEPLRNGKDVLLADANGCGKTLAFVAPLVERLWEIEAADGPTPPGQVRAIIIVPTDSLAQQVCELARNVGNRSIRASMATGEHSWHTQRERLAGGLELLVATMGRLAAHISPREMAPSFSLEGVRMLVVDEASSLYQGRVPSWMDKKGGAPPPGQGKGEPMRQELPLAAWKWLLSEAPDTSSVSFITSALPEGVEEQMLEDVGGLTRRVRPGLHRTRAGVELTLVDCTVPARASSNRDLIFDAKLAELNTALTGSRHSLVLCNTAATSERLQRTLANNAAAAKEHAGERNPRLAPPSVFLFNDALPAARRMSSLDAFRAPPDPFAPIALGPEPPRVLVATGRAVRGLDLTAGAQAIDTVVLFDFPPDAKAYLSRVGCATRGTAAPAKVATFAVGKQVAFARALLAHDTEGDPHGLSRGP